MKRSHTETELEIEVKFHLREPEPLRERILALGAESRGRAFERNICFDTPDGRLQRSDRLLRLRQDGGIRLTYKAPPETAGGEMEAHREAKVYREIELELGSFAAMAAILTELGFREAQTYEKWRETFILGEVHLCLDEMPFGTFLEIEGPLNTIPRMAERLGLNWTERILADYLAIFEAVCAVAGGTAPAPTFAACATIGPLPASLWTGLQVG